MAQKANAAISRPIFELMQIFIPECCGLNVWPTEIRRWSISMLENAEMIFSGADNVVRPDGDPKI